MKQLLIVSRYLASPNLGAAFQQAEVTMLGDYIEGLNELISEMDEESRSRYLHVRQVIVGRTEDDIRQAQKWNELILLMCDNHAPSCIDSCLDSSYFEDIESMLQRFVERICETVTDVNTEILIYGVQMLKLPKMLRDAKLFNKMYYSFQPAFPIDEVARILPDLQSYLQSLLCCNVLMFESNQDLLEFRSCVARNLGVVYANDRLLASEDTNGNEVLCAVTGVGQKLHGFSSINAQEFASSFGMPLDVRSSLSDELERLLELKRTTSAEDKYIVSLDCALEDHKVLGIKVKCLEYAFDQLNLRNVRFVQFFSATNTYNTPFIMSPPLSNEDRYTKFSTVLSWIADFNARFGHADYVPITVCWNMTPQALEYLMKASVLWITDSKNALPSAMFYTRFLNPECTYLVNRDNGIRTQLSLIADEPREVVRFFNLYDIVSTAQSLGRLLSLSEQPRVIKSEFKSFVDLLRDTSSMERHALDIDRYTALCNPLIQNIRRVPIKTRPQTLLEYCRINFFEKHKRVIIVCVLNGGIFDCKWEMNEGTLGYNNQMQKIKYSDVIASGFCHSQDPLSVSDSPSSGSSQIVAPVASSQVEASVINSKPPKRGKCMRSAARPLKELVLPQALIDLIQLKNQINAGKLEFEDDFTESVSTYSLDMSCEAVSMDSNYSEGSRIPTEESMESELVSYPHATSKRSAGDLDVRPRKRQLISEQGGELQSSHPPQLELVLCDSAFWGANTSDLKWSTVISEYGHLVKQKGEIFFKSKAEIDTSILCPIEDLMRYYVERTQYSFIQKNYTNISFVLARFNGDNHRSLNELISHLESGGLLNDEKLYMFRNSYSVTVMLDHELYISEIEDCLSRLSLDPQESIENSVIISIGDLPAELFQSANETADNSPQIYRVAVGTSLSVANVCLETAQQCLQFIQLIVAYFRQAYQLTDEIENSS